MCSDLKSGVDSPSARSASEPASEETCYRLLVEASEDIIFQLDSQGCYLFINSAGARRLGCSPQEMIGRPLSSLFPGDSEGMLRSLQQVFRTGRSVKIKGKATTNGQPVHYSAVLVPLTDATGAVQSVAGAARDISRPNSLLRELKKSRSRFRELVQNMGEGVGIVDDQECFRFANPAAHKLFALSPGYLKGRSLRDFVSEDSWQQLLTETGERKAGKRSSYELEIIRADGQIRTLHVSATPKHSRLGRYMGAFGVFSDVTEKKKLQSALQKNSEELEERVRQRTLQLRQLIEELQRESREREKTESARQQSEMRFRTLFATAPDAVFIKDRDQRYIEANQTVELLFERPAAEIIGKSDPQLFGPDLANQMVLNEQRVLAGETIAEERERTIQGKTRFFHIIKAPMQDGSGNIVGICGIARDITERKAVEAELIVSQERLRALAAHVESSREDENKRIALEIHDELGQNVTAAKLELALAKKLVPTRQSGLKTRLVAAQKLLDSLAGDIRRIAQNLRPPLLDHFGLEAAVECMVGEFINRTGIRCDLIFPVERLPLDDSGATAIFRICQEALTNVARHAEANAVRITFKIDDGNLHIEIADNGKGMDWIRRKANSLGLLGMEERTLRLGGHLTIGSPEGSGTRISVCVPLKNNLEVGLKPPAT